MKVSQEVVVEATKADIGKILNVYSVYLYF